MFRSALRCQMYGTRRKTTSRRCIVHREREREREGSGDRLPPDRSESANGSPEMNVLAEARSRYWMVGSITGTFSVNGQKGKRKGQSIMDEENGGV